MFPETYSTLLAKALPPGYLLAGFRPTTDWYLWVVLGADRDDPTKYATWLYNGQDGGMHLGHYGLSFTKALEDFAGRC